MKRFLFLILLPVFLTLSCPNSFAVEDIVSLDEISPKTSTEVKISDDGSPLLESNVVFDWLDISQAERNGNIEKYKNLLFENNSAKIYYDKNEFNTKFKNYFKDKEYKHHYFLTNNGVTEDEDAKYCAFFFKKKTLIIYAIQYKNNPHNAFYYTAYGKLYYTDVMSDEYPNYPYTSMQYNRKGNLQSTIYFVSPDLQYMFGPNKEFQGIWYKDKMYDENGKQKLTRTNW